MIRSAFIFPLGIRITVATALCALVIQGPAMVLARNDVPNAAVVAQTLSGFSNPGTANTPKAVVTVNSVKFGTPYKATAQQVEVEGIPAGATVTPALVDYTVRTYNTDATLAVRSVTEMAIYRDHFGAWHGQRGLEHGRAIITRERAR